MIVITKCVKAGSKALGLFAGISVGIAGLTLSACTQEPAPSMQGLGGISGPGQPSTGAMVPPGSVPPTPGSSPSTVGGGAGGIGSTATTPDAVGAAGATGMAGSTSDAGPMRVGEYINLAPPMGKPFAVDGGTALTPPPPAGWTWYPVEKTFCRDGSGNGVFIRHTDSDKLLIYFEGGGACTTKGFCHFNPKSVNEILTGTGETVLGTVLAAGVGRQQPGVYNAGVLAGIFDETNAQNPYKGWNMVYIPYCTGDVHFGSNEAAMVPNLPEPQKFVGYKNTREFMSRLAPTFKDKVKHVVVTGASAGSFGAALNFSMISDSFAGVHVDAILDSGAPFEDAHWPACLQKSWRALFGLDQSLPPDCKECFNADGGGLIGLSDFLIAKHPKGNIAAISSLHDEVIRLFFAPGQSNCATILTADPFEITLSQIVGGTIFPAAEYEAGLLGLRADYKDTNRLSTYYFAGAIDTLHQHTFRPRFYETVAGGKSMAQFVTDFLAGTMQQVGP